MQRKYYETKQGIPIYFRDTAPINFDVGILIKKIDKIDKVFISSVKKIIFVRQERLGKEKASYKNGTMFLSNEVYDMERCFSCFLKEISHEYYKQNKEHISKGIKEKFFIKKVELYYDVISKTNRVPLCDFLHEERNKNFDSQISRIDSDLLKRGTKKHFLNEESILGMKEYFSGCFQGYYQKKKTRLKQMHKEVYKIINKAIEENI